MSTEAKPDLQAVITTHLHEGRKHLEDETTLRAIWLSMHAGMLQSINPSGAADFKQLPEDERIALAEGSNTFSFAEFRKIVGHQQDN